LAASAASLTGSALAPSLSGRDINAHDILAALDQRFEHRLAERLLPVNDNTRGKYLP